MVTSWIRYTASRIYFLDDSKILDFSKVVLEGEKRVCNLKLLERKVLGSIITDKNGTSSEVLFMEFRY